MSRLNSLDSLLSKLIKKYTLPTLLACSLLLPSEVQAVPPPPKPALCATIEQCFDQGAELYESGKYRESLPFFQESYKRTADRKFRVKLLRGIAIIYAHLREPLIAKEYLSLYLAENPRDAERKDLEKIVEALTEYAQGRELFKKGDYLAAVNIFKRVYERVVKTKNLRTALLYDIAQGYEHLGKNDLAVEYYGLYLTDAGKKAQDREETEERIARLKKGWSPEASAQPVTASPRAKQPPIQEAAPAVTVAPLALVPALVYAKSTHEKSYLQEHQWSTIVGSGGAAALFGGTVFGYLARSKFNDLTDSCGDTGCQENDIQTVASRSKIANGMFIGSGILGAAAVSLYIWESYQKPASQKGTSTTKNTQKRALGFTPTGLEVKF